MYALRGAILLSCLSAILAACSSSPSSPSSPEPDERGVLYDYESLSAGCYTLTLGAWSTSPGTEVPPTAFKLTEVPLDGGTGQFLVQAWPGQLTLMHPQGWWKPALDGGTIVFGGGFAGVTIHVTGGALQGQAETFTDALPAVPARADAALSKATCS